jgi:hypothetical protein
VRTTIARALLSISCGLLVLATTSGARADGTDGKKGAAAAPPKSDEASERFRSGVAFYKDHDFTAALVEFKRAYELAPNYRVLFNLGQTARELKDYASALTTLEQYLREGGQEVPAARRKDVQASVDELKKKVGRVKIAASVEGAEILVDDVSVGVAPLANPVVVNVGRHKLAATKTGFTPATRMVDVAGMAEAPVTLELARIDEPRVEAPPPPPVKTGPPTVVWVMLGATGASGIVAGVMGGLAVSARSSLSQALGTFPGSAKSIADAQSRTRTFAVGTDVMLGLTAAAAITTTVLFVLAPRGEKAAPAATFGVSPTGLVVSGAF